VETALLLETNNATLELLLQLDALDAESPLDGTAQEHPLSADKMPLLALSLPLLMLPFLLHLKLQWLPTPLLPLQLEAD